MKRRNRAHRSAALRAGAAIAGLAAVAAVALLTVGCGGGSKGPGLAGGGGTTTAVAASGSSGSGNAQHAQLESEYLSFAKCMRSHGVTDFPDPVIGSGGHPGFHLHGGPNSDLNSNNPAFQSGVEACQHILGHKFEFIIGPGGSGKGA